MRFASVHRARALIEEVSEAVTGEVVTIQRAHCGANPSLSQILVEGKEAPHEVAVVVIRAADLNSRLIAERADAIRVSLRQAMLS